MRSDPLAQLMQTAPAMPRSEWLTNSPAVTALAYDMLGSDNADPLAGQWLIRAFLALWWWPLKDAADERAVVERFLGRSYGDPS
jgi:hypothetical protein